MTFEPLTFEILKNLGISPIESEWTDEERYMAGLCNTKVLNDRAEAEAKAKAEAKLKCPHCLEDAVNPGATKCSACGGNLMNDGTEKYKSPKRKLTLWEFFTKPCGNNWFPKA